VARKSKGGQFLARGRRSQIHAFHPVDVAIGLWHCRALWNAGSAYDEDWHHSQLEFGFSDRNGLFE
jgi:hypothetical protein